MIPVSLTYTFTSHNVSARLVLSTFLILTILPVMPGFLEKRFVSPGFNAVVISANVLNTFRYFDTSIRQSFSWSSENKNNKGAFKSNTNCINITTVKCGKSPEANFIYILYTLCYEFDTNCNMIVVIIRQ